MKRTDRTALRETAGPRLSEGDARVLFRLLSELGRAEQTGAELLAQEGTGGDGDASPFDSLVRRFASIAESDESGARAAVPDRAS